MKFFKKDLVDMLQAEGGMSKKNAANAVDRIFGRIETMLSNGDSVHIHDFGTFRVVKRKARTGCVPNTGEKINIPEKNAVVFRSAKWLKNSVQEGK